MTNFPVHTLKTAPEGSKPSLEGLQTAFGFLPNVAAAMATSPVLIGCLVDVFGRVHGGSFTEQEIQVLLLTNAVTNKAEWAVAFHSFLALEQGLDDADVQAIRRGGVPRDPKLSALSTFARTLIERRGQIGESDKASFFAAGYDPNRLLEVASVSAASTITNYTVGITQPPLEDQFAKFRWRAADA